MLSLCAHSICCCVRLPKWSKNIHSRFLMLGCRWIIMHNKNVMFKPLQDIYSFIFMASSNYRISSTQRAADELALITYCPPPAESVAVFTRCNRKFLSRFSHHLHCFFDTNILNNFLLCARSQIANSQLAQFLYSC